MDGFSITLIENRSSLTHLQSVSFIFPIYTQWAFIEDGLLREFVLYNTFTDVSTSLQRFPQHSSNAMVLNRDTYKI